MIKNNIPKLRFPEFSEGWEVKKVGELCDSIVPGRNKPTEFNGEIPWITTPDIEHNGIIIFSKKGLNISRDEAKKVGSKIVPINSIIISCVGDLGLSAITGKEIVINQQLHAFLPKEKIQNRFLLYQLNLQKKYMDKVATKTAVPYMNKDNCNSIPISFPTLPEQQKIATFLSTVDEKLQALKKKKSLLETYKKGVMQKLFSQQIRFKNDDGNDFEDWEMKRLGEICDFYRGSPISKSDLAKDGEFQCIHYGELFTKYNEVISTVISKTNKEKGFLSQKGDILMPSSDVTPKGLAKASSIQIKNVVLGGDMNILRPNKSYSSIYLSYLLNFNKNKIIEIVSGTTVKHIYNKDVRNLEFVISNSLPEQTKIANFLTAIDEKINKVDVQIKQTELWKKGLLQGMFV